MESRSAELSVSSLICGNTLIIGPTHVAVNAGMQNGMLPIPSVLLVLTSRFTVVSALQSAAESRFMPNVRRFNAQNGKPRLWLTSRSHPLTVLGCSIPAKLFFKQTFHGTCETSTCTRPELSFTVYLDSRKVHNVLTSILARIDLGYFLIDYSLLSWSSLESPRKDQGQDVLSKRLSIAGLGGWQIPH